MENTDQINSLINRIEQHQAALKLSDHAFVARYPHYLGSTKTYVDRIRKRSFAEFGKNLPVWVRKLENFVAELDGRSPVEQFEPDMPMAKAANEYYTRLQNQRNDRRNAVLLGATGTGKSTAARRLNNLYPRDTAYVRANESWRESKAQIIQGLAKSTGSYFQGIRGAAEGLDKLIKHLEMSPLTIIIDEAHEGGTMLLKLVKTLIDETSSRFMMFAYPTSWNKMLAATDDARAEAQQLFGRTLKPVFCDYAYGIRREDILIYLRKVAGLESGVNETASEILSMVRTNGNLRLLADAVEMAQLQADSDNETLDGALIIAHVKALCPAVKAL